MAQLNDIKYAALMFQIGETPSVEPTEQHIRDAEARYLLNQIVQTAGTFDVSTLWDLYWDELGIPAGAYNDRAVAFFDSIGIVPESDDYNAYWLAYWTTLLP